MAGSGSTGLFHLLTFTAVVGALYTLWQLPQSLVRYLIGRLFAGGYRIQVMGFENLPGQDGVLPLGNHISWLDWAMVQIACPRPIRFIMDRGIYQRWYLKGFLRCQPWRAKRRLVVPSSREAALFSRRALRQRENKVGLRTRR
ncbi:1-acyl-sn-glycerol-3-phosphate acyltransferase, partial [Thiolapillus sp.]|uniref:1-acyl-sn-glycerol-3-phosphate acyltransferase n=1 Tax=Thiolapillus sp. TaxID=2017437 RepID=UPI003AF74773